MPRGSNVRQGKGGFRIEVTGFRELYDALDELDRKAARQVTAEIRKAGKSVSTQASYFTPGDNPLSNWGTWRTSTRAGVQRDLSYSAAAASAGFKVRRNNFRRRGVSAGLGFDVVQTNPGASIFEVIGSGKRTTTKSGVEMVGKVKERFPGRNPRSLFLAYYAVMPGLRDRLRNEIIDIARKAGLR